ERWRNRRNWGGVMNLGLADIFVILFVTIGPLKAALVYATLAAGTDAAFKFALGMVMGEPKKGEAAEGKPSVNFGPPRRSA
ncbi:MAG: hypothetical protein WBB50_04015, partial [Methyloceanibacter sp.]